MRRWINVENLLIFGEDMNNDKVGRFGDTVYTTVLLLLTTSTNK